MSEEPVKRRRGAETRAAIVDAAAAAIAARGVRNVRVEEVARAAGVSNALLYYYFDDRAALVRAALERANAQAPSMRGDAVGAAAGGTARERLVAGLLAELDDAPAVRDNAVVWNEVSASAVFDPALRDALVRVTDEWNARVEGEIDAGRADGSIAPAVDPRAAAEQLTSLIEGLSLRSLAGTLTRARARELLRTALDRELPPPPA